MQQQCEHWKDHCKPLENKLVCTQHLPTRRSSSSLSPLASPSPRATRKRRWARSVPCHGPCWPRECRIWQTPRKVGAGAGSIFVLHLQAEPFSARANCCRQGTAVYRPRVCHLSAPPHHALALHAAAFRTLTGRNAGIPWADRFAYCQPGSSLEPGVHLAGRCAAFLS